MKTYTVHAVRNAESGRGLTDGDDDIPGLAAFPTATPHTGQNGPGFGQGILGNRTRQRA
jgi:hypothetical protein